MPEGSRRSGTTTRDQLISAGWELIDEIGFSEALRGITVAEVASRAGRSQRTFFNHFDDWGSFVEELVSNIPRSGPMQDTEGNAAIDAVNDALVPGSREQLPGLARAAVEANWREVTQANELAAFRRQMLLTSRASQAPKIQEILGREYYGNYLPKLQQLYESTCAPMKVKPLSPLTWEDYTRLLAAISEGLLLQYTAQPDKVTAEFVVNVTTAVAMALVDHDDRGRDLGHLDAEVASTVVPLDITDDLSDLVPHCRSIVDRDGRLGGWTEIATVSAIPEASLRSRVQRLEVLAAACFKDHLPLEVSRNTPHDWLCQLVREARSDRWCARALLTERLEGSQDHLAMKRMVPLGPEFAMIMDESPRSVHERAVNLALAGALSDAAASPAEVSRAAASAHPGLATQLPDPES